MEELLIPNVFTPNGDGRNDSFKIANLPTGSVVQIFNRWGEMIFESNGPGSFWNGQNKNGAEVSEGVYYYTITFPNGEREKGPLQLLR